MLHSFYIYIPSDIPESINKKLEFPAGTYTCRIIREQISSARRKQLYSKQAKRIV